ncbi:MAG: LysR family transcriptional regulator, partial [Bradyrhizobium sp.]
CSTGGAMDDKPIPRLAKMPALRYFFEVVQYGSFRRAAEKIHVAASAINRQITLLESSLGAKLFDRERGPGGLRLTEAGRILHYRLGAVMNELALAGDEIGELKGLQRGHLRIGVNEVIATDLLPGVIADMHMHYPNLTYKIVVDNTPEIVKRLQDGDVDIGFGYNFPSLKDLNFLAVRQRRTHLITSLRHPLAKRKSVRLQELSGADFILPDRSLSLRRMLDDAFAATNVKINPIMETNSFTLLRTMVQSGLGISIVTGRFMRHSPQRIAFIDLKEDVIKFGVLFCCSSTNRTLSAAAAAFSEAVSNHFADISELDSDF